MAKTTNNPVETMRLDIEFADNGIILRDFEGNVTLALSKELPMEEGGELDQTEAYCAIGKKIYEWLTDEACNHADHWESTGANLHIIHIKAELTGREINDFDDVDPHHLVHQHEQETEEKREGRCKK